jgi:nucleotide-binding universal stress UspA family protein
MFTTLTILFATDFPERAESAFRRACELARERGARLVALHVAPPSVYGLAMAERDEYHRLWSRLHGLQSPDPEVELEHQLRHGDPAKEIVRLASQVDCDLIVLAMRERSGLARFLTGSVVDQVARRAPCPVVSGEDAVSDWLAASRLRLFVALKN